MMHDLLMILAGVCLGCVLFAAWLLYVWRNLW